MTLVLWTILSSRLVLLEESDDRTKRTGRGRPSANSVDMVRAVEARSVDDAEPEVQRQAAVAT